jgi:HK97 gp10 family phage protein
MAAGGIKVVGATELARKLDRLGAVAARRAVKPAVNGALTPINKAAKRNAPRVTGALRMSIGKRVKYFQRTGTIWGGVGARDDPKFWREGPDGKMRKPVFYSHLVELGTIRMPARPFLRPALDATERQALSILRTKTIAGIDREVRKLQAKR